MIGGKKNEMRCMRAYVFIQILQLSLRSHINLTALNKRSHRVIERCAQGFRTDFRSASDLCGSELFTFLTPPPSSFLISVVPSQNRTKCPIFLYLFTPLVPLM